MAEKTKITMIQSADGQTRKVRINGVEIDVMHCGPAVGVGKMSFVMNIEDVEIAYEKAGDAVA
jgi:hypothetical protein